MRFKLLLLLLFPVLFFAQKKDSLKIKRFQFGFGIETNIFKTPNLNDKWNSINSQIIEPDKIDSNFESDNRFYGSNNIKVNWSFQFKQQIKSSKFQFSPRLSYTYGEGFSSYQTWFKSTSFRNDTLTSSQSGEMYFLDSNHNELNHLFIYSTAHHIKLGILLDYNVSKQFSFYSGFEVGLEVHQKTQIRQYYSSTYNIEKFDTNQTSFGTFSNYDHSITTSSTAFEAPKIKAYSFGIPLGIKFRLSKKENFFHKFLCSYEFNLNQIYYEFGNSLQIKKPQQSHLLRLIYEF